MPGVVVTTGVRTGPSTAGVAPASTFFIAGTSKRGPVGYDVDNAEVGEAKLVTSIADFEAFYGGYDSSHTLHQHVQTFFEEGGIRAYVSRVVGASATAGSLSLQDSVPANALTLTAANPGAWSSTLSAAVTTSGGEFIVKIYLDSELVFSTGTVATVNAAVAKINASDIATIYLTAEAEAGKGSAVLAAVAATSFSAGTNPAAVSAANLVSGLGAFDTAYGAGAVAIPGQANSTVYNGLLAHASANNRIALMAFSAGETAENAVTTAAGYGSVDGAEYGAFYFPHVTVTNDAGVALTLSPEAFVAAKRAVAHSQVGPWQAGAGLLSAASYVTGLESTVSKSVGDTLDEGRVNALRIIQGSVRVYGARSVSEDEDNYRFITYRDMLNYIVVEAETRLEDLVFSPIDGRQSVFGRIEARLIGLLDPLRSAGGLYEAFNANGQLIDPGYSVVVNDALNPVSQLATGIVKARVGVRVSSVGDQIQVEVLKSNLTNSVV